MKKLLFVVLAFALMAAYAVCLAEADAQAVPPAGESAAASEI